MFSDLAKALGQLDDPPVRRVLLLAILVGSAVFVVLVGLTAFALRHVDITWITWLDSALELLAGVLGLAAAFVLAWLLFPAVVSATIGLYLERVADAVERRHFPGLPVPRGAGLLAGTASAVRLLGLAILLNLLVLPLYFVPGLNVVVYLAINGYLLGREYFLLVALRRLDPREVRTLGRSLRWEVFRAGVLVAGLLAVPFVNVVAPVVGTALMVHRFHRLSANVARN